MAIRFVRDVFPRERDFRVLIDGEHRATFHSRKRFHQIGYDLEGSDGKRIHTRYGSTLTKAEFRAIVEKHIAEIPTRAQIDRVLMIEQAHRENRERDDAISKHKSQVRNNVYDVAIARYLDNPASPEHADMAAAMLRQHRGD